MATKDQLLEKVKEELGKWGWVQAGKYNTGYGGKGVHSDESVARKDYEAVIDEVKSLAEGKKANFRGAASLSGRDNNEWSILVEYWGSTSPSFNFHIRVTG